jgi:hypothetical protein
MYTTISAGQHFLVSERTLQTEENFLETKTPEISITPSKLLLPGEGKQEDLILLFFVEKAGATRSVCIAYCVRVESVACACSDLVILSIPVRGV